MQQGRDSAQGTQPHDANNGAKELDGLRPSLTEPPAALPGRQPTPPQHTRPAGTTGPADEPTQSRHRCQRNGPIHTSHRGLRSTKHGAPAVRVPTSV